MKKRKSNVGFIEPVEDSPESEISEFVSEDDNNITGEWVRESISFNDDEDLAKITFENSGIRIENSEFIIEFVKVKKFKYTF